MIRRPFPTDAEGLVERSVRAYEKVHRGYEKRHPEIFNPVEQGRLRGSLEAAVAASPAAVADCRAMDLGCGSGNVTRHLLDVGAHVVAADVSPEFLEHVRARHGASGRLETRRLNGIDLDGIEDGSLDLVAAYSVLHHVPDYLAILDEIVRVLRPRGIIYLDHEVNERFWESDGCLAEFRAALQAAVVARPGVWNPERKRWQRFLQPRRYERRLRLRFAPESYWGVEGDIHTWPEKHIEWERVEKRLAGNGCEVLRRDDYLNYSLDYAREVFDRYRETCSDMRCLIARAPVD